LTRPRVCYRLAFKLEKKVMHVLEHGITGELEEGKVGGLVPIMLGRRTGG